MSIAPNSLVKTSINTEQNALNQRVAKLIDGQVVEKYLWANLTTLLDIYDANDNLVQRFEYADQRMPVSMTMGSQKYYLHYDQVGSLRAVSDDSHTVVKEITYDTYGNILTDSNPNFKVPFGFAGGLYDADTKLTRFGYRDYDATTGKWTAKDPIGFQGGDSNLYGYVLGDPVGLFDSSGLLAYNCTAPLHKAPILYGLPLMYHQYTCVTINGKIECNGQDLASGAGILPPFRQQGVPSGKTDEYNPLRCNKRPSNKCFEKCLLKKWKESRPTYGIPFGIDCQDYDDSVNEDCWKKCQK